MKCLLVVNQLNDPFYIDYDASFAEYIIDRAKEKGLLEQHAETTELDANLVMQLFSPLVLSQWLLIDQTKEPCSAIHCPNGFRFVFRHVDDLLFMAINGDGSETETFLRRKIKVFIRLMRFMFGPVSEEMGLSHLISKKAKWDFLRRVTRHWAVLVDTEQEFLVEAIERLHVNQMVSEKSVEILEKAVKQIQAARDLPTQHALLLVNNKLLALYSNRSAHELRPKDILSVMILAGTMYPQTERLEDLFSRQYTGPQSKSEIPSSIEDNSDGGEDEYHSAPNTPGGGNRSRSSSVKSNHNLDIETLDVPRNKGAPSAIASKNPLSDASSQLSLSESETVKYTASSDPNSASPQVERKPRTISLLDMYKEKYPDSLFEEMKPQTVKETDSKKNAPERINDKVSAEVVVHKEVETKGMIEVSENVGKEPDEIAANPCTNENNVSKSAETQNGKAPPKVTITQLGNAHSEGRGQIAESSFTAGAAPEVVAIHSERPSHNAEAMHTERTISQGEITQIGETHSTVPKTGEMPVLDAEPIHNENVEKSVADISIEHCNKKPEQGGDASDPSGPQNTQIAVDETAFDSVTGNPAAMLGTEAQNVLSPTNTQKRDDSVNRNDSLNDEPDPTLDCQSLSKTSSGADITQLTRERKDNRSTPSFVHPDSSNQNGKEIRASRSSTMSSGHSQEQEGSSAVSEVSRSSSVISNMSKSYPELTANVGESFPSTGHSAGYQQGTKRVSPQPIRASPNPQETGTAESSVLTYQTAGSVVSSPSSPASYRPQNVFLKTSTCRYSPYTIHTAQVLPGVTLVLLSQAPRHIFADYLYQVIHNVQDLLYGRRSELPRSRSLYVYDIINSQLAKLHNNLKKFKGKVRNLSYDIHARWEKEDLKRKLLDFLERDKRTPIPPELESPLLELYKRLKELFSCLFLYPIPETPQLAVTLSQLRVRVNAELLDYREYLNVKAQRNITMTSYIDDFPGLIHFIFIDRHFHQITAPSLNISMNAGESMNATSYLKEKIWQMYQCMMNKLTEGYTTVMMRDGDFYFSYFLWFEDYAGNALPVQESFKPSKALPYPGILSGSFYSKLLRYCFPQAIHGSVRCFEMFLLHVGSVHPQYVAAHCKKLAAKMWEMTGEPYTTASLF
ncbi:Hermansky-Pudlak syndrome 1 protein [Aplysia californica]|uniref:Hermansky-Pudlak syndrome 1 protein n=1 Tax=Aplysia californica TaxID=6500 RepID=A0ABM0JDE5_APLCA|nr:Hermansky-Pudlak syndrome 1 protein [Aplysia californica]